ncbi:hypothetical protein B0675_02665 [Streptomyces sp. M41(2017)]|nr:hypothetical protein B0675_02665 [Streptomyces sp. M41(2017)]
MRGGLAVTAAGTALRVRPLRLARTDRMPRITRTPVAVSGVGTAGDAVVVCGAVLVCGAVPVEGAVVRGAVVVDGSLVVRDPSVVDGTVDRVGVPLPRAGPFGGDPGCFGAEALDRGAAPGAGKGAVEVPSARVAVVHDAGRLSSPSVTFLGAPVKVLCGTRSSGMAVRDTPGHFPPSAPPAPPARGLPRCAVPPHDTVPREARRNRSLREPLTPPGPRLYCHASISNV